MLFGAADGPNVYTSCRHKVVKVWIILVFLLSLLLFIPQDARWAWCTSFTLSNLTLLYEFFEILVPVATRSGSLSDRIFKCGPLGCVFGPKVIAVICSWAVAAILGQLNVCTRPIVIKVSEAHMEQVVSIIALVPFRTFLPVINSMTIRKTESTPAQPVPKPGKSSRVAFVMDKDWTVLDGGTESTPAQPDSGRSQTSRRTTVADSNWVSIV